MPGESPLVWQPSQLDGLRNVLFTLYDGLASLPVLGLLFQICVWAVYIPLACMIVLLARNRKLLVVLVPVALSALVCLVAPIVSARYALPLIYVDPLLVALSMGVVHGGRHR